LLARGLERVGPEQKLGGSSGGRDEHIGDSGDSHRFHIFYGYFGGGSRWSGGRRTGSNRWLRSANRRDLGGTSCLPRLGILDLGDDRNETWPPCCGFHLSGR